MRVKRQTVSYYYYYYYYYYFENSFDLVGPLKRSWCSLAIPTPPCENHRTSGTRRSRHPDLKDPAGCCFP